MFKLLSRIQILGYRGFSDAPSQMLDPEFTYSLDSHFVIPSGLCELLLLSCQFSHTLENNFRFVYFVILSTILHTLFLHSFSTHLARNRDLDCPK
jgi:hypothetical protein